MIRRLLGLVAALPLLASAAPPDFSGFWMLERQQIDSDPATCAARGAEHRGAARYRGRRIRADGIWRAEAQAGGAGGREELGPEVGNDGLQLLPHPVDRVCAAGAVSDRDLPGPRHHRDAPGIFRHGAGVLLRHPLRAAAGRAAHEDRQLDRPLGGRPAGGRHDSPEVRDDHQQWPGSLRQHQGDRALPAGRRRQAPDRLPGVRGP